METLVRGTVRDADFMAVLNLIQYVLGAGWGEMLGGEGTGGAKGSGVRLGARRTD